MPTADDFLNPDLQAILLFVGATAAALVSLLLMINRGVDTARMVATVALAALAVYFAPAAFAVF